MNSTSESVSAPGVFTVFTVYKKEPGRSKNGGLVLTLTFCWDKYIRWALKVVPKVGFPGGNNPDKSQYSSPHGRNGKRSAIVTSQMLQSQHSDLRCSGMIPAVIKSCSCFCASLASFRARVRSREAL